MKLKLKSLSIHQINSLLGTYKLTVNGTKAQKIAFLFEKLKTDEVEADGIIV